MKNIIFAFIFGLSSFAVNATSLYPYELLKQNPEIQKNVNKISKDLWKNNPWLKNLNGTQVPIEDVQIGEKKYKFFHVFQAHNSSNRTYFLMNNEHLFVGIHIDFENGKEVTKKLGNISLSEFSYLMQRNDQDNK